MKKKRFVLVEVVLAIIVIVLATLMLQEKNGKDCEKISVVVQNSENVQWAALKYGLKMAAEDQGVEVSIVSTGSRMNAEEERRILENEIENGAAAVIVQPVLESNTQEMLKKIQKKVPVMLVEHASPEEWNSSIFASVKPNDYEIGKTLAEELLKDYSGDISGKKIGILSETQKSESIIQREKGFRDGLKGAGAEMNWSVSISLREDKEEYLSNQAKVDLVIALDDNSLRTAGQCATARKLRGALIYGVGSSTEAIYYLDTGIVECLVVPDEFNVGYQSLTEIAKNLHSIFYRKKNQMVSNTVIRKETLFSKENQEILFTMSQ